MTDEEAIAIAHSLAVVLKEQWLERLQQRIDEQQQRISALETERIVHATEIRLLRELVVNFRDAPSRPEKNNQSIFGPVPHISRASKDAY
jgi:hypothetical protein